MISKQLSILLVDDDEVDRLTVKRALKKTNTNFLLTEVESGKEAIEVLENVVNKSSDLNNNNNHNNNHFDVILLDYRLPDIDGLHLISQIKAFNLQQPIVILTGQGDEKIAVEVMKAGAVDYLSKAKIEPNNFIKAIKNAIRINRAEQAVELANQRLRASNELLVAKNHELERQQEQIKAQNIKLKETIDQRENFVSCLTHDLRTPLVAANRMLDLLKNKAFGDINPEQIEAISNIINSNQNMLEMLNTLLETHHYELGQKILSFIPVDLEKLIREVIIELKPLAEAKTIELQFDCDSGISSIKGDRLELRRAITNLIGNAIKFTDVGSVRVSLSQNRSEIMIEIEDTGIGISPQDQRSIFQRYHQGNHRRSGKGLGLYLTQQIINAHQGKIKVLSQLGSGTVFTLFFAKN